VDYYPSNDITQCIGVAGDLDLNITMEALDPTNYNVGVRLIYHGAHLGTCPGKPRVVLNHYCDNTYEFDAYETVGYPDSCQQTVNIKSIYACVQTVTNPSSSTSGLSAGSVILIM
jgi:hypothetical protein